MASKNLFNKAKKTPVKAAKKDEKITVTIPGKDFDEALKTLAETNDKMKEIKAENDMAKGVVSEKAKEKYAELYEEDKINTGSFNINSDEGSEVMFLPTKRYLKIDEDTAEELTEKYGEDIIDETTVFKFNAKLLEKYMDTISELIYGSTEIDDDDKDNLIEATVSMAIGKDALDKCNVLAKKAGVSITEVLEDLGYVSMLKNPTV